MGSGGFGSDVEGLRGVKHEDAGQESEREQRAAGLGGRGVGQASSPASQEDTLRDVPRGRWTLLQVLILLTVVPCFVKVSVGCDPLFNFSPRSVNFGKGTRVLGLNVCPGVGGGGPGT